MALSKEDTCTFSTIECSIKGSPGPAQNLKTTLTTAFMITLLAAAAMILPPHPADAQEELRLVVDSPAASPSASFDCTKAIELIEDMICEDAELSELDRRLSEVFASALISMKLDDQATLRATQRGWIKARNDCWKSTMPGSCVLETYRSRIVELELGGGPSNSDELEGTAWAGVRIAGDVIPSEIDITLNFGVDGLLNGSAGCNHYFGSFEQHGGDLVLGSIGTTRRLCSELPMVAERRFLAALERTSGWQMKDGQLYLFGEGAELTFAKAD